MFLTVMIRIGIRVSVSFSVYKLRLECKELAVGSGYPQPRLPGPDTRRLIKRLPFFSCTRPLAWRRLRLFLCVTLAPCLLTPFWPPPVCCTPFSADSVPPFFADRCAFFMTRCSLADKFSLDPLLSCALSGSISLSTLSPAAASGSTAIVLSGPARPSSSLTMELVIPWIDNKSDADSTGNSLPTKFSLYSIMHLY